MIVLKFGGTSVKDGSLIRKATEIIREQLDKKPVVVVSAHAKVTDHLIQLGQEALKQQFNLDWITSCHQTILESLNLSSTLINPLLEELQTCLEDIQQSRHYHKKKQDYLMSFGERFSSTIIANFLSQQGISAKAHLAPDLGMLTNDDFGQAQPLNSAYPLLNSTVRKLEHLPVITGFIGRTLKGELTTLGRSGSDFSASIIANAIHANEIQYWKDVPGVMTADPFIVPEAKTVPLISFEEASEMACYGAKILHPSSVIPAIQKNIPIRILNTNAPQIEGTTICEQKNAPNGIKSIVYKREVLVLKLFISPLGIHSEFLQKVFGIFAKYQILIGMIATSSETITLTLNETPNHLEQVLNELEKLGPVILEKEKSLICLIGRGAHKVREVATTVFRTLKNQETDVLVVSQGVQKINIAFIVEQSQCNSVIQSLHQALFYPPNREQTPFIF